MSSRLWSLAEAATRLHVSPATVERRANHGGFGVERVIDGTSHVRYRIAGEEGEMEKPEGGGPSHGFGSGVIERALEMLETELADRRRERAWFAAKIDQLVERTRELELTLDQVAPRQPRDAP